MARRKRSDTATIQISTDNWKELNVKKEPGDSFGEVLGRLLGMRSPGTTHSQINVCVDKNIWRELNDEKGAGDTFDDVVTRLIDEHE